MVHDRILHGVFLKKIKKLFPFSLSLFISIRYRDSSRLGAIRFFPCLIHSSVRVRPFFPLQKSKDHPGYRGCSPENPLCPWVRFVRTWSYKATTGPIFRAHLPETANVDICPAVLSSLRIPSFLRITSYPIINFHQRSFRNHQSLSHSKFFWVIAFLSNGATCFRLWDTTAWFHTLLHPSFGLS